MTHAYKMELLDGILWVMRIARFAPDETWKNLLATWEVTFNAETVD